VIVTADADLPYQQNLEKIGIAAVVVSGARNRIEDLRLLIPQIVAAIAIVQPGQAVEVRK